MVEGIDIEIELKWINKRSEKLQQALLQMEIDYKALGNQMKQAKTELDELRAREIRLSAIKEEEVKKNANESEPKSE